MKKQRFADGGETPALDRLASGEDTGSFDTDVYARAKKFLEEQKSAPKEAKPAARSSEPVPGRPRGESVGEPARRAPMFARDKDTDRNVVAAAARNREASDTLARESRRGSAPNVKRGVISTRGLNPKTLLPEEGYAKGGSVSASRRGDGCAQRGKTRGKFV